MSDFSFNNSTGPERASAFQRLASGSVKGSSSQPAKSASESPPPSSKERGIEASDDAATKSVFNKLSGLESSVDDLRESKNTLGAILGESDDVAKEVVAASSASVRDVEEAAKLAEDISFQIERSAQLAEDAQASGLTPARVERALR